MKIRCLLVVPILAATAFAARQQGAQPSAQASTAARPTPTDQKAYTEASRIKDPQKKIAALEKFLEQYPESNMTGSAHLDILDALIKSQPESKDKILARAEAALQKALSPLSPGAYASGIASRLMKAGLLAEAEQYALKSVALMEEQVAQAVKDIQRQKARPLSVLGQSLLRQGKLKEAEQKLREAYALNPQTEGVATSLAEMAEKNGKEKEAFGYLLAAGRLKPAERQKLETFWRKSHGGSLAGLEEELDARYHKDYSNLISVTRYQPTAKRSSRAVLAEVFTGAACPPCVSATLEFEAMRRRYSREEFIVLMYHQHIPAPDPMTNPASQARYAYYGGSGVPSYTIDGLAPQS